MKNSVPKHRDKYADKKGICKRCGKEQPVPPIGRKCIRCKVGLVLSKEYLENGR